MAKGDVYHYFQKNVPHYNVGVRRSFSDTDGVLLTNEFPTFRVEEDDLSDFKRANKYALSNGLIMEVEEEDYDIDDTNVITDEQALELTKNYAKLKSRLPSITSAPIVQKMLALAREEERGKQVIKILEARLAEVQPPEDEFITRTDMQQTFDDTRY
jgi:hypothetical protein